MVIKNLASCEKFVLSMRFLSIYRKKEKVRVKNCPRGGGEKEKKRKEKGKKERRTRNGRGGRGANDIGGEYKISERDEPR